MAVIQNTGIQQEKLQGALVLWPELDNAKCSLINHTENATFRLDLPQGGKRILRVHRLGYNGDRAILSELVWAKALRDDTGIKTPIAVAGNDGSLVQRFAVGPSDQQHYMVLFEFEAGREPLDSEDLIEPFKQLGQLAARAHNHVQHWALPTGFERLRWDANSILDENGLWGDWRQAPGMNADYRPVFDQLDSLLRERLHWFGQGIDRYGLIHADMRLANLLINGDQIKLIDFDDCGFCWHLYDFAAAVSFIEDSPQIPVLKSAWLSGYRAKRPLSQAEEDEIDTFIMLRRMALTAWIGSHSETAFAQSLAADFVPRGAVLAHQYLAKFR